MQDNVLASGSDDGIIKLWDKRFIHNSQKPIGGFIGHHEGIMSLDSTYLHSSTSQNLLCSNSKDQTLKLWDIRKANSTEEVVSLYPKQSKYDYRESNVYCSKNNTRLA